MGGRGALSIGSWGDKGRVSKTTQKKYGRRFEISGTTAMNGVYTVFNDKERGLITSRFDASHRGGPINYNSLANIERYVKDFKKRGATVTIKRLE